MSLVISVLFLIGGLVLTGCESSTADMSSIPAIPPATTMQVFPAAPQPTVIQRQGDVIRISAPAEALVVQKF